MLICFEENLLEAILEHSGSPDLEKNVNIHIQGSQTMQLKVLMPNSHD